jgi:chemotaxis protein methyltransferase CheR
LLASLSVDGWLILGASDPTIAEHVPCDVVLTDAGLVYRRSGAMGAGNDPIDLRTERSMSPPADTGSPRPPATLPAQKTSPTPDVGAPAEPDREWTPDRERTDEPAADASAGAVAASEAPALDEHAHGRSGSAARAGDRDDNLEARLVAAYERRAFRAVTELAESAPTESLTQRGWVTWLRALANQGRLDEAGVVADRALAVQGPTAELLYLHAVLQLQAGRAAEAAALARRALYLDRTLVVAHLTLADALRRTGKLGAARRSLRNAAALLETLDREQQLPASDGDSAGRLAELVRVKLRLLEEAA